MHLHSNFSDGENSIEEMTKTAIQLGLKQISFTDHVRRTTEWLDDFIKEIRRVKKKYPQIKIYSGIEAKVIDLNGNIDAKKEFFEKVDLVLGAIHRIPKGKEEYLLAEEILADKKRALDLWFKSMMKLLENDNVDIITHPTSILKKYSIRVPKSLKEEIAKSAKKHKKTFEINRKHRVPDEDFIAILKNEKVSFVHGSDSHSTGELVTFSKV
jgi:HisJ family histidinol phosphate phosphatase